MGKQAVKAKNLTEQFRSLVRATHWATKPFLTSDDDDFKKTATGESLVSCLLCKSTDQLSQIVAERQNEAARQRGSHLTSCGPTHPPLALTNHFPHYASGWRTSASVFPCHVLIKYDTLRQEAEVRQEREDLRNTPTRLPWSARPSVSLAGKHYS